MSLFQIVIINPAMHSVVDYSFRTEVARVFVELIECAAREPGRSSYWLHMVTQGVGGVGPPDGGPGGGGSAAETVVSSPLGVMHTSSFSCSSLRRPVNVCIEALPLITFTFSTHWTSC